MYSLIMKMYVLLGKRRFRATKTLEAGLGSEIWGDAERAGGEKDEKEA
jgi:hypothetical protein